MVLFRADYKFRPSITRLTPMRATSASVILPDGRREAMRGKYHEYFTSWEDAHAFLLTVTLREVHAARRALEVANATHGNVKGMKKPK